MRAMAMIAVVMVLLVACGGSRLVETSGSTGRCTTTDGSWTGEALPASGLPGSVHEGYIATCDDYQMSDERVSGSQHSVVDCQFSEDGGSTVGECQVTDVIRNEGGSWNGTCEGTTTWSTSSPAHLHIFDCTYLGSGDYTDLRYVAHMEGFDLPWSVTGTIDSAR